MTRYDDLEAQAEALDRVCPWCDQAPGDPCMNLRLNEPMRGTVHWQRIRAAREVVSQPNNGSLNH